MTTVTLRYFLDGNRAYWTIEDGINDRPAKFCANGYATFRGFNVGERQVHGWASSPLTSGNHRQAFTREARQWAKNAMCDKVSVRAVKRLEDLEALA